MTFERLNRWLLATRPLESSASRWEERRVPCRARRPQRVFPSNQQTNPPMALKRSERRLWRYLPGLILGLWALWFTGIILHGAGFSVWKGDAPDFTQAGAFGDSFGSLASLMAALAAAGALLTLRQQAEVSAQQNFDSNFFGLLDHFQSLTQEMEVHNFIREETDEGEEVSRLNYTFRGHHAFRAILDELHEHLSIDDFDSFLVVIKAYDSLYDKWQDVLGHYFRLLYHLFRIIYERCPREENKYYYGQLVRAHLSTPELILLSYNCICGEGRHKFIDYLQEFSILHNMGCKADAYGKAERAFFERRLPRDAFVSQSQDADAVALPQR